MKTTKDISKHTRGPYHWSGYGPSGSARLCGEFGQAVCELPTHPNGPNPASDEARDTQRLLRGSAEIFEELCAVYELALSALSKNPKDKLATQIEMNVARTIRKCGFPLLTC